MEATLAKYRSLIPSLALLIHLADVKAGGPVGLVALLKAFAWGEYLESHARRIYSAKTTKAMLGASRLAEKLQAGVLNDPFSLRDVYRPGWSRLTTPEDARAAINILVDYGWLSATVLMTDGRPRTCYAINPKLKESST